MGKLDRCRHCSTTLTDGPSQDRSSVTRNFQVTLTGLPTRVCPAGCPGLYWHWVDLGVEVIDMLHQQENFSRPKGLLRRRHSCRACGGGLGRSGTRAEFSFRTVSRASSTIEMRVQGPTLACKACGAEYLPGAANDEFHAELAEAIGKAITKDLIYD